MAGGRIKYDSNPMALTEYLPLTQEAKRYSAVPAECKTKWCSGPYLREALAGAAAFTFPKLENPKDGIDRHGRLYLIGGYMASNAESTKIYYLDNFIGPWREEVEERSGRAVTLEQGATDHLIFVTTEELSLCLSD